MKINKLICHICGKKISSVGASHITRIHKISIQEYYDKYLKKKLEGECETCKKQTKFQNITLGYCRFCSRNCSNQNEKTRQKIKETFIKKYNGNPNKTEKIKRKKEKTFLKHYGVMNCSQHKVIKEKKRKSFQLHYGVDHYSQSFEGRRIHRYHHLRLVENQKLNGDPVSPMVGYQESPFFDELQIHVDYTIIRNDSTFRYGLVRFPDGHIPELKIFIQFDERFHFKDRHYKIYQDDDIRCTLELASLGYLVFRVSEKNWKENKESVLKQFKELISCQKEQL